MANLFDFVDVIPVIIVTLIVGASGLLLYFIINSTRNDATETKKQTSKQKGSKSEKHSQAENKSISVPKSKKKVADTRWSNRAGGKGFSHPWLMTTLKGHTGPVLDVNFSSCGKYLASCGEEDPESDVKEQKMTRKINNEKKLFGSSAKNNYKSKEPNRDYRPKQTLHHRDQSPHQSPMSRRQKKNRKPKNTTGSPTDDTKVGGSPVVRRRDTQPRHGPMDMLVPLLDHKQIYENHFISYLQDHYFLTREELQKGGFPLESRLHEHSGEFYYHDAYNQTKKTTKFDVNAQEFVPGSSSSSSDSSGEDCNSGSSTPRSRCSSSSDCAGDDLILEKSTECKCVRCGKGFFILKNEYLTQEHCHYHWGRLVGPFYTCCKQYEGSVGCTEAEVHVWNGLKKGYNGPISGYVQTELNEDPKIISERNGNFGVFALDCEMCFTVQGLEATKITVVNIFGKVVYDVYIRPENQIVDFNTRFSGITADTLKEKPTKTLKQVQKDLLNIFNPYTVLIGHGLENDLRALKLIHKTIVDTSVVFPHRKGFPFKQSLKTLVQYNLNRRIQDKSDGHDSFQDAWACMDLMLWEAKKNWILFDQLSKKI